MKSYHTIIAACIPLLFWGCASTKKPDPTPHQATSERENAVIRQQSDPRMIQLIRRIEALEAENSELRMQLLKNIL
jgi:hypothetical protein